MGARFVAVVPTDTTSSVTDALWRHTDRPKATIEEIVSALPYSGEDALPSFAVVVFGDAPTEDGTDISVVVRGDVVLDIYSVGGSRRFSAGDASPWVLADFRSVVAVVMGSADTPTGRMPAVTGTLPVARAVVRGGWLGWWLSGPAADNGESASAADPEERDTGASDTAVSDTAVSDTAVSDTVATGGAATRAAATGTASPEARQKPPYAPPEPAWPSAPEPNAARDDAQPAFQEETIIRPRTRGAATTVEEDTVLVPGRRSASRRRESRAPGQHCRVRLADGSSHPLDTPVLIGRKPRAPRIPMGQAPKLITVESASHEVSATHLKIAQEGDSVVVTDLRSTNGTSVTDPDGKRNRIRSGESLVVAIGATIDIGDGNIVEIVPAQ